ncbi:MAG: cation-translocating P-type ATPase [Verrucomicrobia bacterium]|nr:cation-translocating P-type ATPase [Verrucomicrobiota bacterium]
MTADHQPAPELITELTVTGMNCGNCARHAAEALQAVPLVASANVRLEEGRATVRWQPDAVPNAEQLIAAIVAAGYQAQAADPGQPNSEISAASPLHAWKFNVIFGAALTLPLLLGEWVLGLGHTAGFKWFGFAAATPVLVVCGRGFFRGAWQQLRRRQSNMDTLVALGSSTAYGYSLWGLLAGWPGHLYFMEAAAIITLISTGHWLEALASRRATDSLRALMDLTPRTARRLGPGPLEAEIPVAQLRPGDRILLKPGERVPTDGEVLEGQSAIDESMLTGESRPVEKSPGQPLFGGTTVQDGRLVMRVTATGEATALAQIIAVVERAQNSRANIQKLGDRVSSVFVPIVVVLALLTALWWGLGYSTALATSGILAPWLWHVTFPTSALAAAFIHAAAVLIVACPCAMGLATPAAIMAGTNAAARRGILIRDGIALEKSGRITSVVFDKTGTLTRGRLSVSAIEPADGVAYSPDELGRLAARLATPSNHPLSRALATLGPPPATPPAPGPAAAPPENWRELRGRGIEALLPDVPGGTFRLGSLAWLSELEIPSAGNAFAETWATRGATVLGLAQDQRLLARFALVDELKPHAAAVVRNLRAAGIRLHLITGDQRATAVAIAREAGIDPEDVHAEVRPEDKSRLVAELQRRGERVAFVGDGINDAPALEQADLGIAVSKASDVAREAADIILLNSDIQAIPEALGLAQATLRTIKQNLFWAFFYNAAAIPLAALGFLSPVICALAMGLSDLLVIGNALRLRAWKP